MSIVNASNFAQTQNLAFLKSEKSTFETQFQATNRIPGQTPITPITVPKLPSKSTVSSKLFQAVRGAVQDVSNGKNPQQAANDLIKLYTKQDVQKALNESIAFNQTIVDFSKVSKDKAPEGLIEMVQKNIDSATAILEKIK